MNPWLCKAAFVFAIAVAGGLPARAHALTVIELQTLLQSAPKPALQYQELRESPWLSAPVSSRGTMRSTPQALEKKVESPRQETWRLLPDRIEWVGPGDAGSKQILFSQAPALAALSELLRRVVAGRLVELERDFEVRIRGDARGWSAHLKPRSSDVARYLESVELQGTAGFLQIMIVAERQGERTTTRFQP